MNKDPQLYTYETEPQESASIATYSGLMFDVFNPDPDKILIEDIAHALSNNCRWGGHCRRFYSVAQHSTNCADIAPWEFKFEALMHDASEAYLLDMPRPIKYKLGDYKGIEDKLMKAIAAKFGFNWPVNELVKDADEYMLRIEWDNLIKNSDTVLRLRKESPEMAEERFLNYFKRYKP